MLETLAQSLWFIPMGFAVGVGGTLVGAGGGFILVPVLLLLYPRESPELITSISLAVVFFNALSGSVAYSRMRRIDYKSGLFFSAATIPGAILGAFSTAFISRRAFNVLFGLLLIAASSYLIARPQRTQRAAKRTSGQNMSRTLVEANGMTHSFSYHLPTGVGVSLLVGYFSSLLGIGGGIIHVPVLVQVLNFPVHIATATSHFILAIMAFAGTLVHVATGTFHHGVYITLALAAGVLTGAPLGARLSNRLSGSWIIRALAVALALVALRILLTAL